MATRWRMPPENSCGYCRSRASAEEMPTRAERLARASASAAPSCRSVMLSTASAICSPMREHRVQRHQRVLEDHRDAVAAQLAQALARGAAQVLARRSSSSPAIDLPGRIDQPHDREARHRLARTRFADQPQHLAAIHLEIDAVDGRPGAVGEVEDGPQPADLEQRRAQSRCASKLRRSRSPTTLMDMMSAQQRQAGEKRDPVLAREQELEAVGDEQPQRRLRHRHADAKEGKRRLERDRAGDADGGHDQHRADALGSRCARMMCRWASPGSSRPRYIPCAARPAPRRA